MCEIDLYELKIGDNFMEVGYPEIYRVIGFGFDKEDPDIKRVFAQELGTSNIVPFSYTSKAYSPNIVYLSHNF